jgi:hypothetical protein
MKKLDCTPKLPSHFEFASTGEQKKKERDAFKRKQLCWAENKRETTKCRKRKRERDFEVEIFGSFQLDRFFLLSVGFWISNGFFLASFNL